MENFLHKPKPKGRRGSCKLIYKASHIFYHTQQYNDDTEMCNNLCALFIQQDIVFEFKPVHEKPTLYCIYYTDTTVL